MPIYCLYFLTKFFPLMYVVLPPQPPPPPHTPPATCMLVASLEGKQKGLSVLGLEGCHSNHVLE